MDHRRGQLTLEAESFQGSRIHYRRPYFDLPAKYLVNVEVSQSGSELVAYGVVLEGPGDGAEKFFVVVDSVEQEYRITKFDTTSNQDTLVENTFSSAIRQAGRNQIEVWVHTDTLSLAINGQQYDTVTDSKARTVVNSRRPGSW